MKILVMKANSDYDYEIKEVNTLEELFSIYEYLIISPNTYTKEEDFEFWEGINKEDIPTIVKIKYIITIYNDYVE